MVASRLSRLAAVAVIGLMARGTLAQHAHGSHGGNASPGQAQTGQASGDPYWLATDPVSGEALGNHPVGLTYQGRELRFASKQNADTFQANPKTYLDKIDQELIRQQLPIYPLKTCLVSGEKLGGSMGEPVNYVYNNRLVRFCCSGCVDSFTEDSAKYMKKLDEAVIAAQKSSYPVSTCVVTDEKLGGMGKPVDYVVGNQLVQFCCSGCVDDFRKQPAAYLKKLAPAKSPAATEGGEASQQHGHDAHSH